MQRRDFIALLGSVATSWPLSVLAEQGKVAKIGVLLLGYPNPSIFIKGLREGLRDLGYEEGRSVELIIRSADGKAEVLASLAAELTRSQVNMIVAYPTTAGLAAQKATAELPIVAFGGDLEATGLIANLARPGGNVTGVSTTSDDIAAKNLEVITEILPVTRRVAVFVNAALASAPLCLNMSRLRPRRSTSRSNRSEFASPLSSKPILRVLRSGSQMHCSSILRFPKS
jgi:putative tryptophan/tyrosine transport system substrate-binding protein